MKGRKKKKKEKNKTKQEGRLPVAFRDANSGVPEGGGGAVDGKGVVRVGNVAAHVGDDGEPAALGDGLGVQERGDGLHEVNAVHKDIRVHNLGEGTTGGSLGHIPANDVLTTLIREFSGGQKGPGRGNKERSFTRECQPGGQNQRHRRHNDQGLPSRGHGGTRSFLVFRLKVEK